MVKKLTDSMEKLLGQRKALDTKIAKLKEEQKAEKRSAILKVIEAAGLADLQDADLQKILHSLMAAHSSKVQKPAT